MSTIIVPVPVTTEVGPFGSLTTSYLVTDTLGLNNETSVQTTYGSASTTLTTALASSPSYAAETTDLYVKSLSDEQLSQYVEELENILVEDRFNVDQVIMDNPKELIKK